MPAEFINHREKEFRVMGYITGGKNKNATKRHASEIRSTQYISNYELLVNTTNEYF